MKSCGFAWFSSDPDTFRAVNLPGSSQRELLVAHLARILRQRVALEVYAKWRRHIHLVDATVRFANLDS